MEEILTQLQAWWGKIRNRAHFSMHLKYILVALLLRTLNITTVHLIFGVRIFLNNSWKLFIRRSNYLLFLWRFSRTLSKQVMRRVDYFVSKLITNCYPTNNPRCLRYKWLCCGIWEFGKINESLTTIRFNNFEILTIKIHFLLFP